MTALVLAVVAGVLIGTSLKTRHGGLMGAAVGFSCVLAIVVLQVIWAVWRLFWPLIVGAFVLTLAGIVAAMIRDFQRGHQPPDLPPPYEQVPPWDREGR